MANKSFNTQKYAKFIASNVRSAVQNGTNLYLAVGRPAPWINEPNDPDTPSTSTQSVDYAYWRDILGMKKITANDIALVIPRYNWSRGTVYTQYDDTNEHLMKEQFYTVSQSLSDGYYYVYKCLWNNNGSRSDNNPAQDIGFALAPIELGDGYIWKLMYRIDPEYYKFMTPQWIPVLTNSIVRDYAIANAGALPIEVPLVIEHGGVGYDPSNDAAIAIVISLDGDGSGANIDWSTTNFTANSLTSLYLSNAGSGYTRVDAINVTQSSADDDAVVRAIIPPHIGHGYNPESELGAAAVIVTGNMEYSENAKLTTVNDYRRIMLVSNPLLANGNIANGVFYTQTYDCVLTSTTGVFAPDNIITVANTAYPVAGRVVDVIGNVIRITDVSDKGRSAAFVSGDQINSNSGATGTLGAITPPELTFFSGDILYVNHHTTIERNPNQIEEFKIVFSYGSGVSSQDFSSASASPSASPSPSRSPSGSPSASTSPSA